jgi:group II intron reverse transcriptase/maturase
LKEEIEGVLNLKILSFNERMTRYRCFNIIKGGFCRMANTVQQRLETLRKRNTKNHSAINKDLYRLLCRKDFLSACYQSIKSKAGNMTAGTDEITLDGYSEEVVDAVINALKDQSWQFKPVRRKYIPKANGKLRPLGIPAPRDKIIQKGIEIILSAIYEPSFSDVSHGFRTGRSCHSALRSIRETWSGMKWIIEGDIEGCYDNVDHTILMKLLRRRIQDERFLNLIWKLLRAGYEEDGVLKPSKKGCPQGGIVSPVLANIYLHELDIFIQKLVDQHNIGKRRPNKLYESLRGKRDRLRFYRGTDGKTRQRPKSEIPMHEVRRLTKEMKKIPSKEPMDENYKKLIYVRYADDWVIGIVGSKDLAKTIREQISAFTLKHLKLTLSPEKTHISHLANEGANFLGFEIKCGQAGTYSGRSITKDLYGGSKRTVGWQPRLFIPMNNIVKRLAQNNFCTSNGLALKKKGWIVYDDDVIIARYNSVLHGLRNYYAPADNLSTSMNRINYILKYSCAHTLAAKHRTRISKQLRRKDSNSIKVLLDVVPGKVNPWDFRGEKVNELSLEHAFTSFASRTRILSSTECTVCGSKTGLEMHHVKALRKGGVDLKDNYMLAMMQRINRKQICVCRKCHMKIHTGKYDGISLKYLK